MTAKECAIWLGLLSLQESLIGKPSIDTDTSVIIERPQESKSCPRYRARGKADEQLLLPLNDNSGAVQRNTLSDTDHTDLQPVEYHQMHETKQASFTTIASRPLKRDLSGPVSCPSQQNPELHHKTIHSTFDDPSLDCTNHDGQHSQVRTDIHRENDRFLIPSPHRNENEMTGGQSHRLAKDTPPTEQDKSVDKLESADLEDFAATSSPFLDLYLFDFDISGQITVAEVSTLRVSSFPYYDLGAPKMQIRSSLVKNMT
ncbi:hypothetical protein POTOM_000128 [Populus tomentosa]|uniref:Uncharacterized protein n=1 Tax=Populus tomentosa TaxID=118781 RepID=A0A8X8AKK7_POPTO|nr:hypothetical protein POTOM_000128 [Populus tomentosa]